MKIVLTYTEAKEILKRYFNLPDENEVIIESDSLEISGEIQEFSGNKNGNNKP